VSGFALVRGNSKLTDGAQVFGDAWVSGNARISGDAYVYGSATISSYSDIRKNARISSDSHVIAVSKIAKLEDITVYKTSGGVAVTAVSGSKTLHFDSLDKFELSVKNTPDYEADRRVCDSIISLLRKNMENF
jgi:uncharacterized membrane protein